MCENKDTGAECLADLPDEEKVFLLHYRILDEEERRLLINKLKEIADKQPDRY